MKILVTNHWLKKFGGSETFTYTLVGELVRRGHEVDLYYNHGGKVAEFINNDFILTTQKITGDYDLVLANHNTCVDTVRKFTEAPIIQTCHGTTPKLEQPSKKSDYHVAISHEVQEHLQKKGFRSEIILNGIDCTRFAPKRPINSSPKRVLSLSHSDALNTKLARFFHKRGIDFICHNKYNKPVWHIENLMNQNDLVITLGRGAYESMACGRAVLVLDNRKYSQIYGDGIIHQYNFQNLVEYNCSGRKRKITDFKLLLNEALEMYSPEMANANRQLALSYLNIKHQVNKYLKLYDRIK